MSLAIKGTLLGSIVAEAEASTRNYNKERRERDNKRGGRLYVVRAIVSFDVVVGAKGVQADAKKAARPVLNRLRKVLPRGSGVWLDYVERGY